MSVYVIRPYVLHIASTSKHVVTKKEIAAISFSKILSMSVNMLLQKLVA